MNETTVLVAILGSAAAARTPGAVERGRVTPSDYPARERGGSDHDQPFRFGHVPTAERPFPFTLHQFVKLFLVKVRAHQEREAAEAPTNVAAAEAPGD